MILETLTGVRTTLEAAEALGVAPARYYQLETYALQGMVEALEPRQRGRKQSVERELERERSEVRRLSREVARQQALYRSAQRALGVSPAVNGSSPDSAKSKSGTAKKAEKGKAKTVRRRRKQSRGERIAKVLASPTESLSASETSSPASTSTTPSSTLTRSTKS